MPTRFIELAGEVNRAMPDYVVQQVGLALNDRGKAVKGSRILVLGLAYKPDVDDVRESPSFELIEKLEAAGRACRLQRSARARHAPDAPLRPEDEQRTRSRRSRLPSMTACSSRPIIRRTTGR